MVVSYQTALDHAQAAFRGNFKSLRIVLRSLIQGEGYQSGAGAPTTTPTQVGLRYFDTTNKVFYIATASASSADWKIGGNAVLAATAAEINRNNKVSTRQVLLAVTTAITEADHEGKTILMTGAGAARTFTLPAATGGGAKYRFVVGEVNTSGYLIKSVVGTDLMKGCIIGDDGGGVTTPLIWAAGSTDDTITLNGTTTGGVSIGDFVEFEDITATAWAVFGVIQQSGSEATPFSDTVT